MSTAYDVVDAGGYAVVQLRGDVDLSCSPEARKVILHCLQCARHTLVDMSAVTYIDSSGIASLVEGYQTARTNDLRFGLIGVSTAALGVLQLARLDKVFPIHPTLQARLDEDG
jgi:anti-sigma B factor antagonist